MSLRLWNFRGCKLVPQPLSLFPFDLLESPAAHLVPLPSHRLQALFGLFKAPSHWEEPSLHDVLRFSNFLIPSPLPLTYYVIPLTFFCLSDIPSSFHCRCHMLMFPQSKRKGEGISWPGILDFCSSEWAPPGKLIDSPSSSSSSSSFCK